MQSTAFPIVKNLEIWMDADKRRVYHMMGIVEERFVSWEEGGKEICVSVFINAFLNFS